MHLAHVTSSAQFTARFEMQLSSEQGRCSYTAFLKGQGKSSPNAICMIVSTAGSHDKACLGHMKGVSHALKFKKAEYLCSYQGVSERIILQADSRLLVSLVITSLKT